MCSGQTLAESSTKLRILKLPLLSPNKAYILRHLTNISPCMFSPYTRWISRYRENLHLIHDSNITSALKRHSYLGKFLNVVREQVVVFSLFLFLMFLLYSFLYILLVICMGCFPLCHNIRYYVLHFYTKRKHTPLYCYTWTLIRQ